MTVRPTKLKRRGKDKALIAIGALFSVIAIFGASAGAFAYRQTQKLVREELGLIGSTTGEASNWLLVGTDSREGIDGEDENADFILGNGQSIEGRRTDTMMIVRVDPSVQTIDIVSVPRDLWVDINGSQGRVNSAYQVSSNGGTSTEAQTAGRRSLVSTIQSNLGVEINHYAEVDFVGFQNIVDSLGGVVIDFEYPSRDTHSGLNVEAGEQLLDGTQALAYARSRFFQELLPSGRWVEDPSSDLGRTARQRNFIVQVGKALAQKSLQANVIDTDRQISVVADNIVFSSSVSYTSLVELARTYQGVGGDNIRSHSLPVYNDTVGSASVLRLQTSQADEVLDIFRGQSVLGGATVDVLNGSGIAGQASAAAQQLEALNISTGTIGDGEPTTLTELRYNPAYDEIASNFQSMVAFSVVLVEDAAVEELTLVTGSDFASE